MLRRAFLRFAAVAILTLALNWTYRRRDTWLAEPHTTYSISMSLLPTGHVGELDFQWAITGSTP